MTCAIVTVEAEATEADWKETRAALRREGVRVYLRGPTGDIQAKRQPIVSDRERRGCEPVPPFVDALKASN